MINNEAWLKLQSQAGALKYLVDQQNHKWALN